MSETDPPPSPCYLVTQMKRRAKTRELPDNYPFVVTKRLVKEATEKWADPSHELFEAEYAILAERVNGMIEEHFASFVHGGLYHRVKYVPLPSYIPFGPLNMLDMLDPSSTKFSPNATLSRSRRLIGCWRWNPRRPSLLMSITSLTTVRSSWSLIVMRGPKRTGGEMRICVRRS